MKRNIIMLLVAVVILALLAGAYFVAVKWEPEKEVADTPPSFDDTTYIVDESFDEVNAIHFSTGEINYTIRAGETPTIEGYKSHVLDNNALYSVLHSAMLISASRDMGEKSDLSQFGLNDPTLSVTVEKKDGVKVKLLIGNPTNLDGEYFACVEGSNHVYTISSYAAQTLLQHPDNYRKLDVVEIDGVTVSAFTVHKNGQKILEVEYDESYKPTNEYHPYTYIIRHPYSGVKANLDSLRMLFDALTSVTAESIVEENPKNLAKYGLDKPCVINVKDEKNNSTLKMGAYADGDYVYVMNGDLPVVYKAKCPFYETVKNLNADEFVDRFIHLFEINTVKKITVENGEEKHILEIKKKSEDAFEYKIDGKNKVKENFTPVYSKIIGIIANSYVNQIPSGKEICKIKFEFFEGAEKTFTYYDYDDRYCIVKADNGMNSIVVKKDVKDIFEALK